MNNFEIENSTLVVAHPDDEILWFGSIVKKCKKVIICFGPSNNFELSEGREKIKKLLTYRNVEFLNLHEAGVFNSSNWNSQIKKEYGVKCYNNEKKYIDNYQKGYEILLNKLKNEKVIFTHNPWGEYGHEEHIQIFKIISKIKKIYNFRLIFNGYFSSKTIRLMIDNKSKYNFYYFDLHNDHEYVVNIKKQYIENNIWTWDDNYIWPDIEYYYEINELTNKNLKSNINTSLPMNFISYKKNPFGFKEKTYLFFHKLLPEYLKFFLKKMMNRK